MTMTFDFSKLSENVFDFNPLSVNKHSYVREILSWIPNGKSSFLENVSIIDLIY